MTFKLDKILEGDTELVTELPFCRVLLMNDARFPWLILVPRKAGVREIFDLTKFERTTVMEEVNDCAEVLKKLTNAYKINIATLGNVVEQMHIHVIARQKNDDVWPKPVWGNGERIPYTKEELSKTVETIRKALG